MDISVHPPTFADVLKSIKDPIHGQRLVEVLTLGISPAPGGKYRHSDTLRHIKPPDGLSSEEWWAGIKFARFPARREVPLFKDKTGRSFFYTLADPVLEMLQEIDRDASGRIAVADQITNPQTRDRYIQSSLIEEAITSSQLEGASTTREKAKEMLRSGREPLDHSEKMIVNNYRAVQLVTRLRDQPLSRDFFFTLHRTVTEGTLREGAERHYLRQPGDKIGVYDNRDHTLLHEPPPADQILERVDALCRFANEVQSDVFLHPVLKAIILHFWFAYDHPFIDGNGRTARAIFYWSVLSQQYWLFEFISISNIIRKAPVKYARSFLYTETDENDLTYFILAQLQVIRRAIRGLYTYVERKLEEVRRVEHLLRASLLLNHRQLALLGHALRHPGMRYSIVSHQTSHGITYQTARTDLLDLAKKQLLHKTKAARAFVFSAPPDLAERVRKLSR
ncbi:MAG: Fic family protein [Candidatus Binatia bacterium]